MLQVGGAQPWGEGLQQPRKQATIHGGNESYPATATLDFIFRFMWLQARRVYSTVQYQILLIICFSNAGHSPDKLIGIT